jgi:hypothetical protein
MRLNSPSAPHPGRHRIPVRAASPPAPHPGRAAPLGWTVACGVCLARLLGHCFEDGRAGLLERGELVLGQLVEDQAAHRRHVSWGG